MSGRASPSLVLRCPTWDHVEAFYARKVKEGGALSARVPFQPAPGDVITLALELPDGIVVAIDAEVEAASPAPDGVKSSVRLRATGLTESLRGRLAALVAESRRGREGRRSRTSSAPPPVVGAHEAAPEPEPPPPLPTDAPVDELVEPAAPPSAEDVPAADREVFRELERELRRMREVAAHEVLDVRWDASVQEIRRAYFGLTRRLHPDVMARYRSPAIQAMSAEVFIQVNRAYDRMREAAVAGGGAIAAGPDLLPHQGYVAAIEDLNDMSGASSSEQPAESLIPDRPEEPRWGSPLPTVEAMPRPTLAFGTKQDLSPILGALHRELFEDVGLVTPPVQLALDADPAAAAPPPGAGRPMEEVMAEARLLLMAEDWGRARELLAGSLRADPRNRSGRALYHFASARALLAAGKPVEARTQLEVALAHDPQLEEARAAVEQMRQDNPRRTHNLLRRLFK